MSWKRNFTPFLLSGLILLLTLVAQSFTRTSMALHTDARFEAVADTVRNGVAQRLNNYQNLLLETRGLFHAAPSLTRDQFHTYVADLRLLEVYPGMRGIGFARRIEKADLGNYERRVRSEGFPNFTVWPARPREDYFSIDFLEPMRDSARRALGFDMATEPARQRAMEEARDTGLTAATSVVSLVKTRTEPEQPGFLLYVPIYAKGTVPATISERRRDLKGYIFSPFRASDLFGAVFPLKGNEEISFDIGIENYTGQREQIFSFRPDEAVSGAYHRRFTFSVAGRPWIVTAFPTRAFLRSNPDTLPSVILAAGLLLSALSFWLLKSQLDFSLAEKQRNRELALLNRTARRISGELELDKLVADISETGRVLCHASAGVFIYAQEDLKGAESLREAPAGEPGFRPPLGAAMRPADFFSAAHHGPHALRAYDVSTDPRFSAEAALEPGSEAARPNRSFLAVPMISANGAVIGGLYFGHEQAGKFSEREEQLVTGLAAQAAVAMDNARLFQDAKRAVQTRDEFLRIASHELKTPLTPLKLHMQGLSRLLRKGREIDPERMSRMAETADQQIARLNRLVEDLLDVSRISAGLLTLHPEEFDLRDLVRETAERNRPQLSAAGMSLDLDLKEPVWGSFDHLRLEQVLANLLTNALKYAPGSAVTVSLTSRAGEALLSVADQGPGIGALDAIKIFDRFERVGEMGKSVSGLGLGLYITRQIIEAHGGRVTVEQNEPRGARFELRVPLKQVGVPHPNPSGVKLSSSSGTLPDLAPPAFH